MTMNDDTSSHLMVVFFKRACAGFVLSNSSRSCIRKLQKKKEMQATGNRDAVQKLQLAEQKRQSKLYI
jgi:hypothetical protein